MSASINDVSDLDSPWVWLLNEIELWLKWRASLDAGGFGGGMNGVVHYEPRDVFTPSLPAWAKTSAFESRMLDMERAIAQLLRTQPLLAKAFEAEHLRAWPTQVKLDFAGCPARTYRGRLNLSYRWLMDYLGRGGCN